jgi:hypothetical protein
MQSHVFQRRLTHLYAKDHQMPNNPEQTDLVAAQRHLGPMQNS